MSRWTLPGAAGIRGWTDQGPHPGPPGAAHTGSTPPWTSGAQLWGTDWPHPNISQDMPNDGKLVDLMCTFCSDPHLRQKLLVDNPLTLYGR